MMERILAFLSCSVPSLEMQEDITIASISVTQTSEPSMEKLIKDLGEKPKFGSQPKFDSLSFDFQKELDRLPFPLNLGESLNV